MLHIVYITIAALSVMRVRTTRQQMMKPMARRVDECSLRPWLFLLLLPKGKKAHSGYLHDLESYTRNITLSLATTTETGNQDFVVLVDEVQATIVGHEGSDLFAVLDQLDTNAFPDSRVWLLGLDSDLLENDALSMRRSSGW